MLRKDIKKRPLSEKTLASLESEEKDYRELDGAGLYFLVALLHKDLKCKAPLIEPNLRRNLGKWST